MEDQISRRGLLKAAAGAAVAGSAGCMSSGNSGNTPKSTENAIEAEDMGEWMEKYSDLTYAEFAENSAQMHAEEYFDGQVEMDVQSDSYVEVGLPGNIEDHDISSQDAADWIVTHLDEIEDKYAAINNIPNREPEEEMGDWVAEQTGQIVTNR